MKTKFAIFAMLLIVCLCYGMSIQTTTAQACHHHPTSTMTPTITFTPTETLSPMQIAQTKMAEFRQWCPVGVCYIKGTPYTPPQGPTRTPILATATKRPTKTKTPTMTPTLCQTPIEMGGC